MANCSDKKNPLQRFGTAQKERQLPALQNGYVNVDEKTFADWIVFAKEFAQYLNFYELNGAKTGDWVPFFSNDVSAVLGTIAVQDTDMYKRSIQQRFDFLKADDYAAKLSQAEKKLDELFSAVLSFSKALDEFYRLLPQDIVLKSGIENLVKVNLSPALHRLLRYYKGAKKLGYIKPGNVAGWKIIGSPVEEASVIIKGTGLGKIWWAATAATSWEDYYENFIQKDESVFGDDALDIYFKNLYLFTSDYTEDQWLQYIKMNHAANHNLFAGVFDQYLMAHSKLVADAEKELLNSIEQRNTHPSHYALFLAFLRLFRFAQNDLNTITQRHLDFYYKEILRLTPRSAHPNTVHILAELAKPVNDFVLAKDVLLKAGKDSEKKDVVYALKSETPFNKAEVKSLRSVYIGNAGDDDLPGSLFNGRMFAASIINSADGAGAELVTASKEWHPFANKIYTDGDVININMPLAEIGFAIASHYLFLQEGERKIMLRFSTDNNATLLNRQYAVFVTTEKGWYKIGSTVTVAVNNNFNKGTESCAEFSFTLSGDEPAITNYAAKVHGGTLNVTVPVVKILLLNDSTVPYEYESLRDVRVEKMEVAVEAGSMNANSQAGIKNLQLSSDNGIIDGSKAFQPFGAMPVAGNRIVIGSKELLTKKNLQLNFNIEWKGIENFTWSDIAFGTQPDGGSYPNVAIKYLSKGLWKDWVSETELFPLGINKTTFLSPGTQLAADVCADYTDEYNTYDLSSKNGFIALQLTEGFGHKEYLNALSVYLINLANEITPNNEPAEPYAPVVQSLYISYSAYTDVMEINDESENNYANKTVDFFHLYPFGDAEQHAFITGQISHNLFPEFSHKDKDGITVHHEAEFYIGFESLERKQSVNVLFQVMDGSADPTVSKPAEHLQWSFLSNNQWIAFEKQEISDATMQLIQSGIISFIIPSQATTTNTILPAGYLWIKASVAEKSEAVCKLISVNAQAAVATFANNNNAADFLNTALAPATITKLKEPQSAVKKVTQPYSSFGGRSVESNAAFYVRVSERLRHKARAITIWDYEHLILEAFPLIHKVKCLNHTISEDAKYNEVLPGHVTIITIPDLQRRNDINPLKPYTDQATLKSIEAFLKKRISCHVKLHVVNPVFEEVQLKCKLKLAKGYDDFTIYSNKLKEEITSFLSPWANETGDISFGGSIYKSELINFIEERSYVDFITDVVLCHYDENGTVIKPDNDHVIASTAKSILVSVPAVEHEIGEPDTTKQTEQYECAMIAEMNHSKK